LIVDCAQSAEDLWPWHPTASRRTTVGFAEMEMSQPIFGVEDGIAKTVFLDVHMKRIEKDFAVGTPDPFSK
jgi:hypothetical protein